jgi:DNA-binding Lrp family transcriptional regulator
VAWQHIALDTILTAALFFAGKWTPALKRSQSRDLLRFLILRLYDAGRGQLLTAQLTLAQGTLARKLGLSRQWVGMLLDRLRDAGWIEYAAPVLEGGMRGSTIFRIGRQLKRLLLMLGKSRKRRKTPATSAANRAWQFSPPKEEKRQQAIQEQENRPPKPELLRRIPLLKQWMERGRGG